MKGKNFKFILPLLCVILLFVSFIVYKNYSNKRVHSDEVVTSQDSSGSVSKNEISSLEDFKKSNEKDDVKNILYAGNNASIELYESYGKPMMVNFTWIDCAPCKIFDPHLQDAFNKHKEKVTIKDVEVTVNEKFPMSLGVRMTPTQIFYKKGYSLPEQFKERSDFKTIQYEGREIFVHEGVLDPDDLNKILEGLSK